MKLRLLRLVLPALILLVVLVMVLGWTAQSPEEPRPASLAPAAAEPAALPAEESPASPDQSEAAPAPEPIAEANPEPTAELTAEPSSTPALTATAAALPTASPSPTASSTPTTIRPAAAPLAAPPVASQSASIAASIAPSATRPKSGIPILMYHYISAPPADADVYRVGLSVTPDSFTQQMDWLKANGYETITLYHLVYALNIGWPPLPARPVIITFDDGYEDNYQNAFPILRKYGFTATFFVLTDVTDRKEPGYMTWDMLKEMYQAGMSIEVHGREHVDMAPRDHDWLIFHLQGAAETIKANLGYQPRFVAYPAGKYDQLTIDTARSVGYWGGLTTAFGVHERKSALFELERVRMAGDLTLDKFAAFMAGLQ